MTKIVPSVAAVALAALVLTACGSSGLPVMSSSPTPTANGKRYVYSTAHVARSQWPNPCALLSRNSAQAAIGTSVSVKRFHTNCYYQPDSAEYPTLTITLLSVGTASGSSFGEVSQSNKGLDRTSVDGVGERAYLHPVRHLPATRLNVLTAYAHFAVTAQSPVGLKLSASQTRVLLVSIGRIVAKAFRG